MRIRAELHCHTLYSPDSRMGFPALVEACHQQGISLLAVTDHNTIEGAVWLLYHKPSWLQVIVGEEIRTAEGDVIGLFLTEPIEAGMPLRDAIQAIHRQDGLAILPHPFDRVRREAVGEAAAEAVAVRLDGIETFNARCLFAKDNQEARRFAALHRVVGYVGSDAHTPAEVGNAFLEARITNAQWHRIAKDPRVFREVVKKATPYVRPAGARPHLCSFLAKRTAKRRARSLCQFSPEGNSQEQHAQDAAA